MAQNNCLNSIFLTLIGLVNIHGYSLSADVKDGIWALLRRDMAKPDWNLIAGAFDTTHVTVRNIYKKMEEKRVYRTTITQKKDWPAVFTKGIAEVVVCLVGYILVIYQREIAEFIYDIYAIRVLQSQVS